jgi:NTP pyrophosphatase (non-canonical NTP hydrolase)
MWEQVSRLVKWLDDNNAEQSPEMARVMRVLKLSEEVGEVAEAAIGATASNPRKGASHTWQDVENELCDVILTGMVALRTLNPAAETVFADRMKIVAERSLTA